MRNCVSYRGLVAETAALIRADAVFYLIIALYTFASLAFLHAIGAAERTAYSVYAAYWLTLFGLVLPLIAVAIDLARITRFGRRRNLAIRKTFSPSRMPRFLAGMCLLMAFMVFLGTFTSMKNGLSLWQGGFPFDKALADIDAWLHFGVDPWRWLGFAQTEPIRIVVEWNYLPFFSTISLGGLFFVTTSPLAAGIRSRYLFCFMLVWILVGIVCRPAPDHAAGRSQLPERHFLDQMMVALAQDQIGARPRRQDVFAQVLQVDVCPQPLGDGARGIFGQSSHSDGRRIADRGRRFRAAA